MYHLSIGEIVSRSTLARANENRSCLIYRYPAMLLSKVEKQLYVDGEDLEVQLKENVIAIDATIIELCLSAFYRAQLCKHRWKIELRGLLSHSTTTFSTAGNTLD